jgi:hypothetical protein
VSSYSLAMASAPSADAQAPADTRDGAQPPPLPGHGSSDLSPGTSPTAAGVASAPATTGSKGIPAGPNGADRSPARSAEADADAPLARPKLPTSPRRWLAPLLGLAALAGGGAYRVAHWGLVETDNAQLQGHLTEISSQVLVGLLFLAVIPLVLLVGNPPAVAPAPVRP